ncbi:MAG: hypothetical protein GKS05_10990 [Nitrospirales bacterium]|nr:hypothetical protein [Nitrospirales bacterium]
MKEFFVPTLLSGLYTLDPGEIREIQLTLPSEYTVEGKTYSIRDTMRPGTAFLGKPWGLRTEKFRRRMYTRSNCSASEPGVLTTIINDTHREKADTSPWWLSHHVEALYARSGTVDVRLTLNDKRSELVVYESASHVYENNLRLEPDAEWANKQFLGLAFSTGITPFLAHLRYMKLWQFGRTATCCGATYVLIVSVRNPKQLMAHEELLELETLFPENFKYHPVLTREWPDDWLYTTGRIMHSRNPQNPEESVNISPLLRIVPDCQHYHVRMCGNRNARDQLLKGLEEHGTQPLSFRAEVW